MNNRKDDHGKYISDNKSNKQDTITNEEVLINLNSLSDPFICHDPHDFELVLTRDWAELDWRRYVLIDPGKTYFCMRIEKRDLLTDEVFTEEMVMINFNSKSERWTMHSTLYGRINNILDKYLPYFKETHIVAIEKQYIDNIKMLMLMQHLITYFCINIKNAKFYPLILELNNQVKTKVFGYKPPKGASKDVKDRRVKKWAEEKGYSILRERGDMETVREIRCSEKMNDPYDTVVMGEALYLIFEKIEINFTKLHIYIPKEKKVKTNKPFKGKKRFRK